MPFFRHFHRAPAEVADHTGEDKPVDGVQQVPVGQSKQALGGKKRGLNQSGLLLSMRVRFKLQPGTAWKLHLCAQQQVPVWFHSLHSPEIDRIPDPDDLWVAPPAP